MVATFLSVPFDVLKDPFDDIAKLDSDPFPEALVPDSSTQYSVRESESRVSQLGMEPQAWSVLARVRLLLASELPERDRERVKICPS